MMPTLLYRYSVHTKRHGTCLKIVVPCKTACERGTGYGKTSYRVTIEYAWSYPKWKRDRKQSSNL